MGLARRASSTFVKVLDTHDDGSRSLPGCTESGLE